VAERAISAMMTLLPLPQGLTMQGALYPSLYAARHSSKSLL